MSCICFTQSLCNSEDKIYIAKSNILLKGVAVIYKVLPNFLRTRSVLDFYSGKTHRIMKLGLEEIPGDPVPLSVAVCMFF